MTAKRSRQRTINQWSRSPEWYTPSWLLDRVRAFYGGDFFDPCPARHGQAIEVNGLMIPWTGRAFVNPPYGRLIVPWIRKAMTEPVRELILLVPAYTDTNWFEPLFSCSICFVHGRIHFEAPDGGIGEHAPHASVLVYRGRQHRKFAEAFSDLGPVLRQYQPRKAKQPRLLSA